MSDVSSLDTISELIDEVGQLKEKTIKILNTLKSLQKDLEKEKKIIKKPSKKPSGFAMKGKISEELCNFMNLPNETEIARTDATKYLIDYIKSNNLQDKSNKSNIIPDDILKTLLKIEDNETLTYFNIQKKMNIHFIKN